MKVDLILHPKILRSSGTGFPHGTKAVSIVDQKPEIEIFLSFNNLIQLSKVASHTENTLGNNKDPSASFFNQTGSMHQLLVEAFHVIVLENKTFSGMEAQPIHNASMRFSIVYNYIVTVN